MATAMPGTSSSATSAGRNGSAVRPATVDGDDGGVNVTTDTEP
jgi:hypothetical protein